MIKKHPTQSIQRTPMLLGGYSLLSILAFILGFIFWPVGFVLGLIALSEMKKYPEINEGSKYLAWGGMLIQPILILFGYLMFNVFMWFIGSQGNPY